MLHVWVPHAQFRQQDEGQVENIKTFVGPVQEIEEILIDVDSKDISLVNSPD
jgi:hypothetical protein